MNALALQAGGPTAVVNASLAALVRGLRELPHRARLFGGHHGFRALSSGEWTECDTADETWLRWLDDTPGMALGGGRDHLDARESARALARLREREIDVLVVLGGNGSMAAARALHEAALAGAYGVRIIAVPKTIDNDIPGTEICPGYLSAARYIREAVRDIGVDAGSMRGYEDVVLIETMGRHTGWLAAASLLARITPDDAPHLVLLPEQPIVIDDVLQRVQRRHHSSGVCVVVVAEGVRDEAGTLLTEKGSRGPVERDPSGQVVLSRSGGPLGYLADLIRSRLHLRCRIVRPDVLQRCSRGHVSPLDRHLAALAGGHAATLAGGDASGVMVSLRRQDATWSAGSVPLTSVQGERTLPGAFDIDDLRTLIEE